MPRACCPDLPVEQEGLGIHRAAEERAQIVHHVFECARQALEAAQAAGDIVLAAGFGLDGKLGVGRQLPAQGDEIAFAFGDELLGQLRRIDAADDCDGNR